MCSVRVILLHPGSGSHFDTTAIADDFTMEAVLPLTTGVAGYGVVIRRNPLRTPTRGVSSISSPVAHINIEPGQRIRTRETQGTLQDLRHLMVTIGLLRIDLVDIECLPIRRHVTQHRGNDHLAVKERKRAEH